MTITKRDVKSALLFVWHLLVGISQLVFQVGLFVGMMALLLFGWQPTAETFTRCALFLLFFIAGRVDRTPWNAERDQ